MQLNELAAVAVVLIVETLRVMTIEAVEVQPLVVLVTVTMCVPALVTVFVAFVPPPLQA